jgi:hypothetical protein
VGGRNESDLPTPFSCPSPARYAHHDSINKLRWPSVIDRNGLISHAGIPAKSTRSIQNRRLGCSVTTSKTVAFAFYFFKGIHPIESGATLNVVQNLEAVAATISCVILESALTTSSRGPQQSWNSSTSPIGQLAAISLAMVRLPRSSADRRLI